MQRRLLSCSRREPTSNGPAGIPGAPLAVHWLGRIGYREAWDLQKRLAAARAAGRIGDQLLLLEHPAVLTLGRAADEAHVLAPPALLEARGIEVLRVERGGEVTYHGPGQLVAYPIVRLADRGLLLRPFVRALEGALSDTCAAFGVAAGRRDGHPGCWVDPDGPLPRKIGALGLRVERGVDLPRHRAQRERGPRGLRPHRPVRDARARRPRSIASEAGRPDAPPSTRASRAAAAAFAPAFARRLGATLEGVLPPDADPAAERADGSTRLAGAVPA